VRRGGQSSRRGRTIALSWEEIADDESEWIRCVIDNV